MTDPMPTIRVNVAPCNPGQFFACCGLLELADRLWEGAEGWFEKADRQFCLRPQSQAVDASAERLFGELARCRLTNTMTAQQLARLRELAGMKGKERARIPGLDDEKKALEKLRREAPLLLHEPFRLRIDWFLDGRGGGDRFKTWAGQQSVVDIGCAMKDALESGRWQGLAPDGWFTESSTDDSLPFNFDSDLGGQGSALDIGFSGDPLGMSLRSRPLVEFAAFIGLQRFRPFADPKENRYTFTVWREPLPPILAAVAACGFLGGPDRQTYEFRLLYRTKYLKSFLSAQPIGDAR
jgi:CRISPR-associated protein Csb3